LGVTPKGWILSGLYDASLHRMNHGSCRFIRGDIVIAVGNNMKHCINGAQFIDFADNDPKLALSGRIPVIQIHTGEPMWVEVKDVRVKEVKQGGAVGKKSVDAIWRNRIDAR
jgi:hypothetical protein